MQIISHRGYWKNSDEKNRPVAFERSFSLGFGTETDVRDLDGKIVISHDMPVSEEHCLSIDDFLRLYSDSGKNLPLALNIKSDGLQDCLKKYLERHDIKNYRLFDMSIPDLLVTKKRCLQFLTRYSDIEREPILINDAKGIWLDSFASDWFEMDDVMSFLRQEKEVWIVSPELHRRDHTSCWEMIKECELLDSNMLFLCTDLPETAREYFDE